MSLKHLKTCTLLRERAVHKVLYQIFRCTHESRNMLKLSERGMYEDVFPNQANNEIIELLASGPQTVYAGFDPTASSLHVGNLLILKNLLHWQRGGHKVIALIGTATAQIGDPSGRHRDREEQSPEIVREQGLQIRKNIETICANHEKYFWSKRKEPSPLTPITFLNNEDWYSKINIITFLNTIGRHFRMGNMLLKDSVNRRISSEYGMCLTEFTYQIFQAFDWYHLYNKYNCQFQVGGKDQMGNMEAGHRLIRRLLDKPSYALTMPLISNDAGDKFGKSVENAVWLDPLLTTPFDFYQFFIRRSDAVATQLYRILSFGHFRDVENIIERHNKEPDKRLLQAALADELTLLVHGEEGLESARKTSSLLYSNDIETLGNVHPNELVKVFSGCTVVECRFRAGYSLLEFALDIRCFLTKADAHRVMNAGGFYINLERAINPAEVISQSVHILPNSTTLVRVGKKNFYIVKWTLGAV